MNLQSLLGDLAKEEFVDRYFLRLPYSRPQSAKSFCELGTWHAVGQILADPTADVLVARDGIQYGGPTPKSGEEAQTLSDQGYTTLVRHAERHHPGLAELAQSFHKDFCAPVDVHIYATPPGRHGFGWHFDAEDVFIIQTNGAKEYALRKNTVHPWPLVDALPDDMGYAREIMPLLRVLLVAGDWLYIPCGYWHKAEAAMGEDTAISLAVGVMSHAALDVLDFARAHLQQSLIWRQRVPVCGAASPLSQEERLARLRELLGQLAEDLRTTFRDEQFARAWMASIQDQPSRKNSPT